MNRFPGSCHCGDHRVELMSRRSLAQLGQRRCGCDFCTRHGPRYISDPHGTLVLSTSEDAETTVYRHGHSIADFLICSRCGDYLGARRTDDDGSWMVLNANLLDDRSALDAEPPVQDLSAEDGATRRDRQRRRWTPLAVRA